MTGGSRIDGTAGARGRGEGGFVVVELVAGLAVLVVAVALLVLALPVWSERQDGRGSRRVRSVAPWRMTAAAVRCGARRLGVTVAVNLGVPAGDVSVAIDCQPGTELPPASRLTTTVTVTEPGLAIPAVGRIGGWSFTARHAEPVDRYAGAP